MLNEPNIYGHFSKQKASVVQVYTQIYDGVTTVLHRDHPTLQFAAMCWAGIPDSATIHHFMDRSNHDAAAPWPPAFVTFHIYEGPTSDHNVRTGFKIGLGGSVVNAIKVLVDYINTSSAGRTRSYVDEMGIFGCPDIDYTTVLDGQPGRFGFHNPRAAWFASVYGQLASIGVDAMGSSQFFGYDSVTGRKNDWPAGGQQQSSTTTLSQVQ